MQIHSLLLLLPVALVALGCCWCHGEAKSGLFDGVFILALREEAAQRIEGNRNKVVALGQVLGRSILPTAKKIHHKIRIGVMVLCARHLGPVCVGLR